MKPYSVNFNDILDKPCAARQIKDRSIICVCNTTYCDEFTREKPVKGSYVTYTSSEAGSRFKKGYGVFHDSGWNPKCCSASLVVNSKVKYQVAEGFGGAVTDAASINWKSLPEVMQQSLIDALYLHACSARDLLHKLRPLLHPAHSSPADKEFVHLVLPSSYYSSKGLEYNMIRVPIGGCDFSTHAYAYNELPENDIDLLNFNLTSEDFEFKPTSKRRRGSFPWQKLKVDLGSWPRAVTYISDILEDLNHNVVGWIDWNLCLNTHGGPNWSENYVDSPIIVDVIKNEFYKQPMFYAMGHFSKFIKRGSRRIEVNEIKRLFSSSVKHVGFLTPDGTVVLVLLNEGEKRIVSVRCGKKKAVLELEAKSVTTMEFYCVL
ncbi:Glucosylceramidase [Papilio machaon]|uniref:Glucosylceramidase n=1 Tax=Papilio machaon TaxID=76193 RepID=A0A0N1INL2_PAPMA|nr:Glucosylceramidase [Papilio machaon]